MIIIRDKDRQSIEQIADETVATPCEIIAYGSRVDGTAHDTSDLDLVIKSKDGKALGIDELIAFKDAMQNSTIPILVQIFDWYRVPESFRDGIISNCEVLCEVV